MARWYEDYIHNGHKLAGEPLDDLGREALRGLTAIVDDPANWIEFRIERGQLQYINNRQFAHSRTAFKDARDGSPRRHLIRIWRGSFWSGWLKHARIQAFRTGAVTRPVIVCV